MLFNNVIIVGSGTSLLWHEKGKLIDCFDVVVRLNNYAIAGYERHVGERRDYHFRPYNIRSVSNPLLLDDRHDLFTRAIILPPGQGRFESACVELPQYKYIEHISWDEYKTYCDTTGCDMPSTGICAVLYFMERSANVTVTGLDTLQGLTSETEYSHYYSDKKWNQKKRKFHCFEKERQLFSTLKVKQL